MRIITISREFGSGGREIGKRLADALNIAYYDREIITAIAKKSSLEEDYIERILESSVLKQYPVTFSRTITHISTITNNAPNLLAQQHKVIKELAAKGDCVIVGRGADIVLEEYQPLKLFVYADMTAKVDRCRERAISDEKLTDREFERKIKQVDKARASNHNFISSLAWGDKQGYHLCINTTEIEIKSIISPISAYSECWFERSKK